MSNNKESNTHESEKSIRPEICGEILAGTSFLDSSTQFLDGLRESAKWEWI
jgi:hypothetical protein